MSAIDLLELNKPQTDNPLYVYNTNGDRLDISAEPTVQLPDLVDNVRLSTYKKRRDDRYKFNDKFVPRVTNIINYCNGDTDALCAWAAQLGKSYFHVSKEATEIGTYVHEAIAEYLTSKTIYCIKNIKQNKDEIYRSVANFISWYKHVTENVGWTVNLIASEISLVCPWCGGTADAILDINRKRYLVDFKTSKRTKPEYFIQTSAYKWIIDNFYPEHGPIDGLGILRFDKYSDIYQDLFLDLSNPNNAAYVEHCTQTFGLALNMYYAMNVVENETQTVLKDNENESNRIKVGSGIHDGKGGKNGGKRNTRR